jgi:hypothetical protein
MIIASGVCTYAAQYEKEPNNSMIKANTIEVGTTVYGELTPPNSLDSDFDYFKFKAPVSGTVTFTGSCDVAKNNSDPWKVIFDYNDGSTTGLCGNLMYCFYGNLPEKNTFKVVAGKTYYITAWCYYENAGYHFTLKYNVNPTKVKKVTAKKKGFNVQWNKKSSTAFYQVQYTPKSTFDNYNWTKAKTVKVSAKRTSKTINKLPRLRKYCVRVRVARKINGKIYYSPWSTKKIIRTK